MDAFFASCEIARNPQLRGLPVIVGTGARAVVSAASYEARRFGVNSAMPVAVARRRCPQGVFLPVDMAYYRSVSARVFAIFEEVTPFIEKVSVDEGYLDVSGALGAWPEGPEQIGAWIRRNVHDRLGVTCSVGIASNKLIAKLASTTAKPNGMLIVPKGRNAEFIQVMPLRSVPGIGPSMEKSLAAWGCTTVAQLAVLSEDDLVHATGSRVEAHRLWLAARGEDERHLVVAAPEKSVGYERTFDVDHATLGPVDALVRTCSEEVAARLRARELVGRTVSVKVRYSDLHYVSRVHSLDRPVNTAAEIYPVAHELLCSLFGLGHAAPDDARLVQPVRLAGVSVSSLESVHGAAYQPTLEDLLEQQAAEDDPSLPPSRSAVRAKSGEAEKAIDGIRERFGKDAVSFGIHSGPRAYRDSRRHPDSDGRLQS